jgi:diadenosine tetraphosphate (Ap4A) HIT family hydrolase
VTNECVFGDIVADTMPASRIYEDQYGLAFIDL